MSIEKETNNQLLNTRKAINKCTAPKLDSFIQFHFFQDKLPSAASVRITIDLKCKVHVPKWEIKMVMRKKKILISKFKECRDYFHFNEQDNFVFYEKFVNTQI